MKSLMSLLGVPVVLLNIFSATVASIWLLILGQWAVVAVAAGIILFAIHALALALSPTLLVLRPEYRSAFLKWACLACALLYTVTLIVAWGYLNLEYAALLSQHRPGAVIPIYLMSYATAIAPWQQMAKAGTKTEPDNNAGFNLTFFFAAGYWISMMCVWLGSASLFTCVYILSGFSICAQILTVLVVVLEQKASEMSLPTEDVE